MPTLIRMMKEKQTVVFHCALSQVRGPKAALAYLRACEQAEARPGQSIRTSDRDSGPREQKVLVLTDGFEGWQRVYRNDERLTEGWRSEIWDECDD
jgi:hypothetical protein